jgi:hypothetical protein
MQLHVATDPFQPIARLRAWLLTVGFCAALAVGPYLWFLGERIKTPSTPAPPAPLTVQSLSTAYFQDGGFTKDLDRYLVESSPVTDTVRTVFSEFLLSIGRLQPPNLVRGKAGYYFLRSAIDSAPLSPALATERVELLQRLAERAKKAGVQVVCVVVPDKANTMADMLPSDLLRSPERRAVYADAMATLRSVGFEVPDFDAFARRCRIDRPGEALYTRLETHWTMEFAFRCAEHVLHRLMELGEWSLDRGRPIEPSPTMMVDFRGDLVGSLHLSDHGFYVRDLRENRRMAFASAPGADGKIDFQAPTQPDARFALAGDSFATALGPALVGHLGTAVDFVGVMPGKGPVVGLVDVLRRIEASELKARVVVWGMVERSWTEDWWRRSVLAKLR